VVSKEAEFIYANCSMSKRLKNIYQLIIVFTAMTITGSIALALRIISFGLLTNFNRKYTIAYSSKFTLWIVGIKLDLPKNNPIPKSNCFITFNHNSYLDIFALTALGYTNTIFLLSEKTLKIIPVTLSALSIGVAYIPQQKHAKRRLNFFIRLERRILKRQINVAGASEGVHNHHHGIDRFNRGVYHMAKLCNLNIIPLYINVPKESNPFNKYKYFKRGTIKIEKLDSLSTDEWTIENLDMHVKNMRNIYVNMFNQTNEEKVEL
jgi:putative phosphoserine phosphatase/1-acylglycerol-3-phosphate O-acyltransferase